MDWKWTKKNCSWLTSKVTKDTSRGCVIFKQTLRLIHIHILFILFRIFGIFANVHFIYPLEMTFSQCLKITEKVAFNIASEASYVFILSEQKFIKKSQKSLILASFWKPEFCCQIVLPDRTLLQGQKLVENAKIQMGLFGLFSNNVHFLHIRKILKRAFAFFNFFIDQIRRSKALASKSTFVV